MVKRNDAVPPAFAPDGSGTAAVCGAPGCPKQPENRNAAQTHVTARTCRSQNRQSIL
jgi:hypothetical protein